MVGNDGEDEASRPSGLRKGNAVFEEMERGVYLRAVEGVVEADRYVGASVSLGFTTADHLGLFANGAGPGRGVAGLTGGAYAPCR